MEKEDYLRTLLLEIKYNQFALGYRLDFLKFELIEFT
jgi:hypothetical protein